MPSLVKREIGDESAGEHSSSLEVGSFHATSSDLIFPSHKFSSVAEWRPQRNEKRSLDQIIKSIDSLHNGVGNGPLDLLQYRITDYTNDTYIQDLQHLSNLLALGKFKRLGLIDVDAAHLELVLDCGFPVTYVQVPSSILDRRFISGRAAAICIDRGVTILARNALLGGFLADEWLGKPQPASPVVEFSSETPKTSLRCIEAAGGWEKLQGLLGVLSSISRKHRVSIGAVAARHMLDIASLGGLIIEKGEKSVYCDALSLKMEATDRAKIEAIQSTLSVVPGLFEPRVSFGNSEKEGDHCVWKGQFGINVSQPIPNYPRWEYSSGSKWEPIAGYCRAVRIGNRIRVSGTTANSPVESIPALGGTSVRSQLVAILDIIERALMALGASMRDLVHTRIMVVDAKFCDEVSEVHGDRMRPLGILPANTLVANGLMEKQYLVEVEAEAEMVMTC